MFSELIRRGVHYAGNFLPQIIFVQEAAQFLPKGCSRKMPPSFSQFEWGRLLEHSFLEHFCLDQFSVIQGKFYMQYSRTPRLVEHFWVPILGASCSNKLFVGTVRPSHLLN